MILDGEANKNIAADLGLSQRTVDSTPGQGTRVTIGFSRAASSPEATG